MAHTVAYPKILALGTPGIESIFEEPVEVTEKLDGSQFGFGKVNGEIVCRSKGREIDLGSVDKLFQPSVEHVLSVQSKLPDNYFFYGEAMSKPRASTLAYGRVPKNHIALFAVSIHNPETMETKHLPYKDVKSWAKKLNVEPVALIYEGMAHAGMVLEMLETDSALGAQKIEGTVVKNYKPWYFKGREIMYPVMAGKYVSEAFKEVHVKDWKRLNTGKGQLEGLKDKYRSETRWHKALMRLKENGEYTQSLKDIGALMKSVNLDLLEEEQENIKEDLWKIFGADITRHATRGLPEWYKKTLLAGMDKPEGETSVPDSSGIEDTASKEQEPEAETSSKDESEGKK